MGGSRQGPRARAGLLVLCLQRARAGTRPTPRSRPCSLTLPHPPHPTPTPRSYGVAFLHETQSEGEQAVARLLFESGAAQVLVATAPMCWGLTASAHLAVIMGTQVRRLGGGWMAGWWWWWWWWVGCGWWLQVPARRLPAGTPACRPPQALCPLGAAAAVPDDASRHPVPYRPILLQYYDVTGQGTNDYPVTDLLQMMGRASRPLHDEQGM